MLDRPAEPVVQVYVQDDVAELESDVLELAAGPLGGDFEVSPAPHFDLCATCPGRRALCSWTEEMTLRPEPVLETCTRKD
jgi:ATP-dependent helicase/nuclease subunit A